MKEEEKMYLQKIEVKDSYRIPRAMFASRRDWVHYVNEMVEPWGALTLHGFGKSRTHKPLVELAEALYSFGIETAKGGGILNPDFRGHGESYGDLVDFTIQSACDDAAAAFDSLAQNNSLPAERIIIIGHSIGALIAVILHNRLAGKTGRLILISPAIQQDKLLKSWYSQAEIKACQRHGFLDTKKGRLGWAYFREALSGKWLEQLKLVKNPVLVLHGADDADVPMTFAEEAAQALGPYGKLVSIKGADHNMESHQAKEQLKQHCLSWLKEDL